MTCKQKNLHAHTMFLPPPRYFPACFRPSALFRTTDLAYFIPNPKGLNPCRALGDRVTSSFPHHPPPCLSPCDGSSAPSPCYPSSPGHRQPSTRSQGDAPTSSLTHRWATRQPSNILYTRRRSPPSDPPPSSLSSLTRNLAAVPVI
jgi:hypothetical protein